MPGKRIPPLAIAVCVLVIAGSALSWWMLSRMIRETDLEAALRMARVIAGKDMALREWIAGLGGIYAPETENTPPNPYLPPQGRELFTVSGMKLTRINPSYATRLVNRDTWLSREGISSHSTSLKPLRAENYPSQWETDALQELDRDKTSEYFAISHTQDEAIHFLLPLPMQADCLPCHATQGYQVGDQRGGLSVSFPLTWISAGHTGLSRGIAAAHLGFAALALLAMILFLRLPTAKATQAAQNPDSAESARQRTLENKLEELSARYQEALRENEKQRALSRPAPAPANDLLSRLGYEIRTPLNTILGMSYLLEQTGLDVQQRHYLEQARLAGGNVLVLINDILDYSRIDSGKLQLVKSPFSLPEMLDALLGTARFSAQEKGLELRFEQHGNVPESLVGDAPRLTQILTNLLGNAIAFTEQGEIVLGVRLKEAQGLFLTLEFSVRDSGIGIPPERRETLFQPFYLFEDGLAHDHKNVGLGLAVSERLARLMDGELRVESAPGQGSVFTCTVRLELDQEAPLPAKRPEQARDARAPSEAVPEETREIVPAQVRYVDLPAIRGARVLLVENDAINQEVALNLLRSYGMEVRPASNGMEAVLHCRNDVFDIVLMALHMPVLDGLEAARKIRAFTGKKTDDMPIIGMVAPSAATDRKRCLDMGINGFMSRPVDPEETAALLLRWIDPKKIRQDALLSGHSPVLKALVLPPTLPGVDLERALRHTGGNPESLIKHLSRFHREYGAWAEHLAALMEAGQWEEVARNAHTLRAVAGALAITQVAAAARDIETACPLRKPCPELLAILKKQLDTLRLSMEETFLSA